MEIALSQGWQRRASRRSSFWFPACAYSHPYAWRQCSARFLSQESTPDGAEALR